MVAAGSGVVAAAAAVQLTGEGGLLESGLPHHRIGLSNKFERSASGCAAARAGPEVAEIALIYRWVESPLGMFSPNGQSTTMGIAMETAMDTNVKTTLAMVETRTKTTNTPVAIAIDMAMAYGYTNGYMGPLWAEKPLDARTQQPNSGGWCGRALAWDASGGDTEESFILRAPRHIFQQLLAPHCCQLPL
jgi:hypothetical protein